MYYRSYFLYTELTVGINLLCIFQPSVPYIRTLDYRTYCVLMEIRELIHNKRVVSYKGVLLDRALSVHISTFCDRRFYCNHPLLRVSSDPVYSGCRDKIKYHHRTCANINSICVIHVSLTRGNLIVFLSLLTRAGTCVSPFTH